MSRKDPRKVLYLPLPPEGWAAIRAARAAGMTGPNPDIARRLIQRGLAAGAAPVAPGRGRAMAVQLPRADLARLGEEPDRTGRAIAALIAGAR